MMRIRLSARSSLSALSRSTLLAATALLAAALTGIPALATPAFLGPTTIAGAAEARVRAAAGPLVSRSLRLQVAPLDPRLRLHPCDRPLTGFITGDGQIHAQTTVGVSCRGRIRWTLYVSVSVSSQGRVLVARRDLSRSTVIGPGDFALEKRSVPGLLSNYATDIAKLGGQQLRFPVQVDQPLSLQALAPVELIHRGQQVELEARSGALVVRMTGVALADGQLAQIIPVQNLSSRRVVEGIVRSGHLVQTPL